MHEELSELESGERTQTKCGFAPDLPKASAASEDILLRLGLALRCQVAPPGGNIARLAAASAVALARCPVRHARLSPASWPPLQVPSTEAGWQAPPPVTVAVRADAIASCPGETLTLAGAVPPMAGVGASAAWRAFSYCPGDRVLPRLAIGPGAVDADGDLAAAADRGATGQPRPATGIYVRKAVRWMAIVLAAWFGLMSLLIMVFRFVDPPGSTLILWQAVTGTKIEQSWVPLSRISSNLRRAVVVSEDGRFCQHWGVDPREVLAAIQRSRGGVPRGASTITMQVAKNLFLWPSKSYLRKALEVPLAFSLELFWPKWRILEVYLNIAEWGPGVFGAEAAARYHFRKPANRLSGREAALLAVALPNPIERRAGKPGPVTARLASLIQSRVRVSGDAAACVLRSR